MTFEPLHYLLNFRVFYINNDYIAKNVECFNALLKLSDIAHCRSMV